MALLPKVARDAAKAAVLGGKKVVTPGLLEGAVADQHCEGEDAAGA